MKNKNFAFSIAMVFVSLLLVGIDQLTKWLAVEYLKELNTVSLIKFGDTEWLNLTYCENTGMAFSLLEGQRFILVAIPIVMVIVIEWLIFSGRAKTKPMIVALSAFAAGGAGNLIDRILHGYVVDFIDFRIINFAVFNFADICAVLGGIFFAVLILMEDIKEEKEKKRMKTEIKDENP